MKIEVNFYFRVSVVFDGDVVEQDIVLETYLEGLEPDYANEIAVSCIPLLRKCINTVAFEQFNEGSYVITKVK